MVYSVLCDSNEAQYTVDRVETYLFHGCDRQCVLPDIQMQNAISHHA